MTKATNKRQLRLLILDILNKYMDSIPDGLEFYLTDGVATFIRSVYEEKEDAVSVRERLFKSMQLGAKRSVTMESISNAIKVQLHINASEEFIEFAYNKSKHGEDIDTFCDYWQENGGDPIYWSEKRMKMLWPQAFIQQDNRDDEYIIL